MGDGEKQAAVGTGWEEHIVRLDGVGFVGVCLSKFLGQDQRRHSALKKRAALHSGSPGYASAARSPTLLSCSLQPLGQPARVRKLCENPSLWASVNAATPPSLWVHVVLIY